MKKPSKAGETQAQPGSGTWDALAVVLVSAAIFCVAHLPALTNPYVVNDDVRQQLFWMQQWRDPGLFQGDLLSDYARLYVPWGVKGLYWLASWVADPIFFSKILTGLLFIFLGVCIYRLGRCLGDRSLGWLAVGVFWLMPFFLDNLSGGLARGFAAPLLALFLICWVEQRPWGLGLTLVLQALFIPYIFMIAALAVGLNWLAGKTGRWRPALFPARPAHWLLLAAGAGLVLLMQFEYNAAGFGPLVHYSEMYGRPEFYGTGRYPLLPVPSFAWELISPWEFNLPFRQAGPLAGAILGILVLGLAIYGARRVAWRTLAQRLGPLACLGLASLLMYVLARLLLLRLFVPDRYLIYTLNLFYCLGLAVCFRAALPVERWPRVVTALSLALLATLSCWHLRDVGLKDYSAYRPMYAALAQTPKDALIAGHPNVLDNVPTFAHRRAFATYKLAHVWSKGYWAHLRPRLTEMLAAYYAADPMEVVDFCRRHRISFLVVDDRHFTPAFLKGGWFLVPYDRPQPPGAFRGMAERTWCPFFAPFDQQIRDQVGARRQFAVLSDFFQPQLLDSHLRLLDLRPWLKKGGPG